MEKEVSRESSAVPDEMPVQAMEGLSRLTEIWESALVHKCITVAARLGVADELVECDLSLDELALRTGAHAPWLKRVLRLLCAHGLFEETEDRRYRLTPVGECLRSDVPWSYRWGSWVSQCQDVAGSALVDAVRSGECPFEKASGKRFWQFLAEDSEANDFFNLEMQAHNATLNIPALLALTWDDAKLVVDVGGGSGEALSALLQVYPHLNGILVDQAQVMSAAVLAMQSAGVFERCTLVPANFFERVPADADTYVLARVLHDWGDDDALAILGVIRNAIPAHGRLLIVEMIVPARAGRHISKAADVSMLLLFGEGRERSLEEFDQLLAGAGFRIASLERSGSVANVIVAVPTQ